MDRSWASLSTTAFTFAAAAGCAGNDLTLPSDPGLPAAIIVVKGNGQEAPVGSPLRDSLTVKVTDIKGTPVPQQQVVFILDDSPPGARVTPDATTTGADGTAAARWVLGVEGGTQKVLARVVSDQTSGPLEVRFTASAIVPVPSADLLALRRQPSASARAGVALERQPVVQIQDAAGNDVARSGVPVTAAIASGRGTLSGTTTRFTNAGGRAEFTDLAIDGGTGAHSLIFAADGYASVTGKAIDVEGSRADGGDGGGVGDGGGGGGDRGGAGGDRGGGGGGGGGGDRDGGDGADDEDERDGNPDNDEDEDDDEGKGDDDKDRKDKDKEKDRGGRGNDDRGKDD